jgi:hypothetical protein
MYFLLQDIGFDVELPIVVKPIILALYLCRKMPRQAYVLVMCRYHFIRENVEDGIIKIEFVKSNDNDSDIFTKNVYQETYERHVKKFLGYVGEEYGT